MVAFLGSSATPAEFSNLRNGIQVTGGDITDGSSNVIYDQVNNELQQERLENDSITFTGGDGIGSLSSTALGGSISISVTVSDLTGKFISDSGSNDFTVNLGRGITEDANASGNIALDESTDFTFTSEIDLDAGAKLGADINADNSTIINVPDPVNPGDIVNKDFVDTSVQGLDIKQSSDVATESSVDLTSTTDPRPIDGVSISDGAIVLLKEQSSPVENGLYVANTASDPSSWTRTDDFDNDIDVTNGAFTFVEQGNNNASTSFTVTSSDPLTVGTDPITFNQFTTAGEILGGDGLIKSGRTLDINVSDFITGNDGLQTSSSDILVKSDSSLSIDGSGNLSINTSNTNTFSAVQNFNSGLDVGSDITSGTTTIYDSVNDEIPDGVLGTINNSTLANTTITVNANDGLSSGGSGSVSPSLGGSFGLQVAPGDFIDTSQLSISNGDITIDDIFLSNSGDRVTGSFTFADLVDLEPVAEPAVPDTSEIRLFLDSNDTNLKAKAPDGSVATIVST